MASVDTLHAEIEEQADVLARVLAREGPRVADLARRVRARGVDLAVIAARGTSGHAATYLRYLLETLAGLPVSPAAPSVFTLYDRAPRLGRALVVGISQSGRGEDVRTVLEAGRRQGAITVAITNAPDSPLAAAAHWVLDCQAAPERAIPATKSYTAQLALAALLAAELAEAADLLAALPALPAEVAAPLEREVEIAELADAWQARGRWLALGRGYNLATAQEVALKVKEMAGVAAESFAVPDFLHGHLLSVAPDTAVLLAAPADRTLPSVREAARVARERGGRLLALCDEGAPLAAAEASIALPPARHEALRPFGYTVAGQLFAYHLARARGLDPGQGGGLAKVTSTR